MKSLPLKAVPIALPLILLAAPAAAQVDFVRQQLTSFIEGLVSNDNQKIEIEGLSGIPFDVTIDRITIADTEGVWLTVDGVTLDIAATALLRGRLRIDRFGAEEVVVERAPVSPPVDPNDQQPFTFPEPPQLPESVSRVVVENLVFDRIELKEPVLGEAAVFELKGSLVQGEEEDTLLADLEGRRVDESTALLTLEALFKLEEQAVDLDLHLEETGGLFASISGIPEADRVYLDLTGEGPLENWQANLVLDAQSLLHANANLTLDYSDTPEIDLSAVVVPVPGTFPEDVAPLLGKQLAIDIEAGQTSPGTFQLQRLDIESAFLQTDGQGRVDFETGELTGQAEVVLPDLAKASALAGTALEGEVRLAMDAKGSVQEPLFEVALQGSGLEAQGYSVQTVASQINVEPLAPLDQPFAGVAVEGGGRVEGVLQNDEPLRPEDSLRFEVAAVVPTEGEATLRRLTLEGDTFAAEATADLAMPSLEGTAQVAMRVPDLARFQEALGPLAPQDMDLAGGVELALDADLAADLARVTGDLTLEVENLVGLPADTGPLLGPAPALGARFAYVRDERIALESLDLATAALDAQGRAQLALPSLAGSATLSAAVRDVAVVARAFPEQLPPDAEPQGAVNLEIDAEFAPDFERVSGDVALQAQGLAGLPANLAEVVGPSPSLSANLDYVKDERVVLEDLDLATATLNAKGTAELALPSLAGSARLDADVPDIAPLASAFPDQLPPGTEPTGRVDLQIQADVAQGLSGATADLVLAAQNLGGLPAGATSLIGSEPTLKAVVDYAQDERVALTGLDLDAANIDLGGEASLGLDDTQVLGGRLTLRLPDLAALEPLVDQPLSGKGEAVLDLGGTLDDLDVRLDAGLDPLNVAGQDLERVALDASLTGSPDALAGEVGLAAVARGEDVALDAAYALTPTTLRVDDLTLAGPATDLQGNLVLNRETNLVDGRLQGRLTDLAALEPFIGQPLGGAADVDLRLEPAQGRQNVDAKVNAPRLTGAFGTVQDLALSAEVRNALGDPVIDGEATLGSFAQDTLRLAQSRASAQGSLASLNVEAALAGAQDATEFDLETAATLDLEGDTKEVLLRELAGSLAGEPVRLRSPARAALLPDGYALEDLDLVYGPASLVGDARLAGDVLTGSLLLEDFRLSLLDPYLDQDLDGVVGAEVALSGRPGEPRIEVSALGREVRVDDPAFARLPPARVDVLGAYADETFTADLTATGVFDEPLGVEVELPMVLSLQPFAFKLPQDRPIDGQIDGVVNLSRVTTLAQLDGQTASGDLRIDLGVDGTLGRPLVNGNASLQDGTFTDAEYGVRLRDLTLDLQADGRTIEIARLTADAPEGRVNVEGTLEVEPERNFPYDIRLDADNARLLDSDLGRAVVNAGLEFSGDTGSAALTGDVTIERADLRVPSGGLTDPAVLDVVERRNGQVVSRPEPEALSEEDGDGFALGLNVTVNAPERIFVRGRGLESEWGGRLEIEGTASAPEIVGSIDFRRGFLDFLDQRFQIQEGTVTFTGDTPPVPQINLVAEAEREGFTAIVRVTGPATDPQLELDSQPPLPQDEILARLLFDRDVSEITPAQGIKLAAAVRELQGGGPGVLDKLRDQVGLDTLDIGGEGPDSAVSAGKYISDDVFLEVEQGLTSGTTKARVEIDLGAGFDATTEVGSDGNTGAGINWSLDY